jgi:two-component system, chemotaxis family, chemotaxis protein CheV
MAHPLQAERKCINASMKDIEERANLTNNNQFELLLFRLDDAPDSELYGINVFKVRESLVMPPVIKIAGAGPMLLGMADIRGQVIPVVDLPRLVSGTAPAKDPNILLVTEYLRSTQGFAVEAVEEIVHLEWNQVVSAENNSKGSLVTSIAKLDTNTDHPRLVQVLDVEQILREVLPTRQPEVDPSTVGPKVMLRPSSKILAADDSAFARSLIEQGLEAMGVPLIMTKTGQEAWGHTERHRRASRSPR